MLNECMEGLIKDTAGIYVDATLGGAGHAEKILSLLGPEAVLYGIDQDPEAIAAAVASIGDDPRFIPVTGNFGYLSTLLPPEIHGNVDGILLDLGVSTHQLKEGARGFSFQEDGPLDMRMSDATGITAYQVVNEYDFRALRDVIFHYGEEMGSRQIAKAIIEARPVETTGRLAEVIKSVVHPQYAVKSLARVFQGIRIEVNRELEVLKDVLEQSLEVLKPGGRLVVMSYHSLEDRIVKRFFNSGNLSGTPEKDFYGHIITSVKPVNRQVITPLVEEVERNPAARSAKLRIAEKINGEN